MPQYWQPRHPRECQESHQAHLEQAQKETARVQKVQEPCNYKLQRLQCRKSGAHLESSPQYLVGHCKHYFIHHQSDWWHLYGYPGKKCFCETRSVPIQCPSTQYGLHRPVLPVRIQSIMLHIHLQLGTNLNDSGSPSIRCAVDTAAALCTGNYHFFAAIAKRYPQCVAKIFLPEDYSPISYLASFRTMLMLSPLT